jgi:hypothetical protein
MHADQACRNVAAAIVRPAVLFCTCTQGSCTANHIDDEGAGQSRILKVYAYSYVLVKYA